jgi:shikimate dehydrogenase
LGENWRSAALASPPQAGGVLVGLLGQGIAASRTPAMHLAAGEALGIPYEYRLFDTARAEPPPPLASLLPDLQRAGFTGLNVTYPFKQAVLGMLDRLSDAARAVGAVNTIVFRDGQRFGHNTDYWGFAEALRRGLPGAGRATVLLLGAGGAGGAVAQALLDGGTGQLLIRDTDPDRAEALAQGLCDRLGPGRARADTDLAAAAAAAEGIVNASPMGMDRHPGLPIEAGLVEPRHWVADIVYFPLETALLALARSRGCRVLPGSGMALFQAVRAFELLTGRKPDPDRMQAAFDRLTPGGR